MTDEAKQVYELIVLGQDWDLEARMSATRWGGVRHVVTAQNYGYRSECVTDDLIKFCVSRVKELAEENDRLKRGKPDGG